MNAYHCDADGCDSWQRCDSDSPAFYTLVEPDEEIEWHFCSLNCAMLWAAAHSSPSDAHEIK